MSSGAAGTGKVPLRKRLKFRVIVTFTAVAIIPFLISLIVLFKVAFDDVAELTGATLTPFILEDIADKTTLMQSDGIHPRAEAQATMLDNIWPQIEKLLVSVHTDD